MRSQGNPNSLLAVLGNNGNKLVLLRFVNSVIVRDSCTRDVIGRQFRILAANGRDANF